MANVINQHGVNINQDGRMWTMARINLLYKQSACRRASPNRAAPAATSGWLWASLFLALPPVRRAACLPLAR